MLSLLANDLATFLDKAPERKHQNGNQLCVLAQMKSVNSTSFR